ncbi:hypothetical protein BOX15_Mlig002701g1 [Macrostomum lignano]|uniref:Uncharacterized protein n=2 Tax=Macrostomum lignano TaxID=282301 RepID=A0A1I8G633_9PLAT|nr:hypothetical protein BOX15_Mlig002701g1 [Macrostomum lignano]
MPRHSKHLVTTGRLSSMDRQARVRGGNNELLDELRRQRHRRQQQKEPERISLADDYLASMSNEDEGLYEARMRYLRKERRPSQSRQHRRPPPAEKHGLINFANTSQPKVGQKTILSYSKESKEPTKDLKMLVLALVRRQLRDEVLHMSEIAIEQNPFEMGNMRLNSFIANTPDLMDHWKVMMLEEGMRLIDESFDVDNLSWVAPGLVSSGSTDWRKQFSMPIDELTLVSLPPDKPEISRSQVATEYIQAQRGRQGNEAEEAAQLFQSELLKTENAAAAPPETFERVCSSYKAILQKAIEIEYIEGKQETCDAIGKYIDQLKNSVEKVVSEALANDIKDTQKHGSNFLHSLIGKIMDDLRDAHKDRNYEPMRIVLTAHRRD